MGEDDEYVKGTTGGQGNMYPVSRIGRMQDIDGCLSVDPCEIRKAAVEFLQYPAQAAVGFA
jgi:hypothetical protein